MQIPFLSQTKRRCSHQTKDGAHCNATPQRHKDYCFFHDPDRAPERTAARRQGGLTSIGKFAPVVPPNLATRSLRTFDDVRQLYEDIVNYVLQGQMDLRTANSLRSMASGVLRTLVVIERSNREAPKASLPGKAAAHSFLPRPFAIASSVWGPELETENSGLIPPVWASGRANQEPETVSSTLPGKAAPASILPFAAEEPPAVEPAAEAPATLIDDTNPQQDKHCTTADDDKARQEKEERLRRLQVELLANVERTHDNSRQESRTPGMHPEVNENEPPTTPPLVRDPDNEPSPIPGLLNRHLNYLRFAGMPVSELQRRGFVPSRWKSKFVRG
jgi:hypothetical protein